MKHGIAALCRHILCLARAFRFPIDAQRALGAMERQSRKRQDKQEELPTDKAVRRRYGLCTRFDRGPV